MPAAAATCRELTPRLERPSRRTAALLATRKDAKGAERCPERQVRELAAGVSQLHSPAIGAGHICWREGLIVWVKLLGGPTAPERPIYGGLGFTAAGSPKATSVCSQHSKKTDIGESWNAWGIPQIAAAASSPSRAAPLPCCTIRQWPRSHCLRAQSAHFDAEPGFMKPFFMQHLAGHLVAVAPPPALAPVQGPASQHVGAASIHQPNALATGSLQNPIE